MTPRDNFIHFLRGEPYEWIPTNLDTKMFAPTLIKDNVARGLVAQQSPYTGPMGGLDMFGVEWIFDKNSGGSMEVGQLLESMDDLEHWEELVKFPDLDALDWEGCARENSEFLNTDKLLCTMMYTGFFERMISFIGFEESAITMIDPDSEEYVCALFDRLADYYIDLIGRLKKHFNIELVEFHDDWGTQRGTIFSPAAHARMIAPYIRRVTEGAHALGVYYEQHSCGLIETLIPQLIDAGADTWRGQRICDKKMLVDRYGDRFRFGVEIRPDGPVDDETAFRMAEDCLNSYRGKHVWLAIGRVFTPAQQTRIEEMIHAEDVPA